jgi:hypothetical protein
LTYLLDAWAKSSGSCGIAGLVIAVGNSDGMDDLIDQVDGLLQESTYEAPECHTNPYLNLCSIIRAYNKSLVGRKSKTGKSLGPMEV